MENVTAMFMSQHSEFLQSHSSSRKHFALDYSRHAMPKESNSSLIGPMCGAFDAYLVSNAVR